VAIHGFEPTLKGRGDPGGGLTIWQSRLPVWRSASSEPAGPGHSNCHPMSLFVEFAMASIFVER
jgi:hypothetical protein